MALFKKIKKIKFANGNELIPNWGEYAVYDGNDIFIVKEEDMSVKIIKLDDEELQIVYSADFVKHPIREEEEEGFDTDFELEPCDFDNFDDSLYFFDYLNESFQDLATCIELMEDKETNNNITKKFTVKSQDGNRFEFKLGVDFNNKKSFLYIEIIKKNNTKNTTIFKTYLNKTNMKKFSKSLLGIKTTINERMKKNKNTA